MPVTAGFRIRLTSIVNTLFTATLLLAGAGCEELGISGTSSELATDDQDAAAPAIPPPQQPRVSLPPLGAPVADPNSLSGEEFATWFAQRRPNEITDADLQKAATVPEVSQQLAVLDLRGAALTAAGLESLSRMPELRTLDLSGCVLSAADWQALGTVTQLENLSLESAAVGDTMLQFMAQLQNLRALNLRNTNLTDLPFVHFKNLSRLEELHLDGVQSFTGAGLEALGPKGAKAPLRILTATGTKLGVFGFQHLNTMQSLEVLAAGGANVSDDQLSQLRNLTDLRVLQIGGNAISDQGLRILTRLKQLEDLDISGSQYVTNDTLERIKNHKQLTTLKIDGTSCNLGGVYALKGFLPDCEIHFGGTVH